MRALNAIRLSGREVLPVIEGGKGIGVTNGLSSGAWAAAGGVGTFSGVNADYYDENGRAIPQIYRGRTRKERHEELVDYAIRGGIAQARIAHDVSGGGGRLHMNVLWEMAAAERILNGVLEATRGLITAGPAAPHALPPGRGDRAVRSQLLPDRLVGAGLPRALEARLPSLLRLMGGVVYEDPWRAGGHNGLSNSEDPEQPEPAYPRVLALREQMRECGLDDVPIVMAAASGTCATGRTGSTIPSSGPSSSSSEPARW